MKRSPLLALLCTFAAAPAQDPPAEIAGSFVEAWRDGDAAGMAQSLPGEHDLSFRVAHELFGRHVDAVLGDEHSDLLAAAADLAGRVRDIPGNAALPDLVARWQELTAEDLRIERRLRRAVEVAGAAREASNADRAAGILEDLHAEIDAAPWSIAGQTVLARCGQVLLRAGRAEQGFAVLRDAARHSRDLGWPARTTAVLLEMQAPLLYAERYDEALAVSEELARLFGLLGEEHDRAVSLLRRAVALKDLERLAEAADQYRECAEAFTQLADEKTARICRIRQGEMLRKLGRFEEALAVLEEVRRNVFELTTAWRIRLLAELAAIHAPRGDLERWREVTTELRRVADTQDDLEQRASVYLSIAELLVGFGEVDEAEDLLDAVAAMKPRDSGTQGRLYLHRASAALHRGDLTAALDCFDRGIAELERTGVGREVAVALIRRARARRRAGLLEHALADLERARRLDPESGALMRDTLQGLADVYRDLGRLEEARDTLRALRTADQAIGMKSRHLLDGRLARLEAALGNNAKAVEICLEAAARAVETGDLRNAASLRANAAMYMAALGRGAEALPMLVAAVEQQEELGDRANAAIAWGALAAIALQQGELQRGEAAARRALELGLSAITGLGEAAPALLEQNRRAASNGVWAAQRRAAAGELPRTVALYRAFWFMEAGQGLLLAQTLSNRGALLEGRLPPGLVDAERRARLATEASQQRLTAALGTGDRAAVRTAAKRLAEDYRRLDEAALRVQRAARAEAGLLETRPAELDAVLDALPEDAALLVYRFVEGEELFVVGIAGNGDGALFELGDGDAAASQTAAWLRAVSTAGVDDTAAARAAYDALLRPLEEFLAGKRHVLVVPDGELCYAPFGALVDGDGRRVVERRSVSYLPSASTVLPLRAAGGSRGRGLLALGDPVYPGEDEAVPQALAMRGLGELRRLRGSGEEVRAIAGLFGERAEMLLRERATRAEVERALAALGEEERLRVLHLACHGHVDEQRPRLTGLVLAGAEMLNLAAIYRMRVPADLVVLSACDTARGKFVRGAGVMGLVRGFMHAGARDVVVSDWPVEDAATRELMVRFYRELVAEGVTPAEALRRAKIGMLGGEEQWRHPAKWAGFVLWGLGM